MLPRSQRRIIIPFILPAAVLLGALFFYPLVKTFFVSTTRFSRTGRTRPAGFDHYRDLLNDAAFFSAMKNSFLFALIGGAMLFPVALALAWALMQKLHGESLFRFFIFAPVVLSASVVALLWKFLYHPTLGLINPALKSLGLGAIATDWLGNPSTALSAVALTVVWQGIGIWVILLAAGLEQLPIEVIQAARIDGASEWRVFRSVMLPMLRDVLRVLVILWLVQAIQAFAYVHIMTDGGPFGSSEIVANLMYRTAFDQGDFGRAAAQGILLVLVLMVLAFLVNTLLKGRKG